MFKSARWRSEKNKIKAVFKLEFHATQLTELVGDALMIFIIPADVGKPTGRLEKVKVKDESCYWQKPHFETVKFTQDPKIGKFHEKIYNLVVSTGSLKFGGVGEVSIDFASYAEATKLSSLSLPLKTANSDAVLHVSIQRVQDSLDQREIDGSENANYQDRSLRAQFSNGDIDRSIRSNPTDDHGTLNDNINRDSRGSSGSDITLSSSDSSSGLEEPEPKNTKSNTKSTHESATTTIYEEQHHRSSQWDWLDDSSISPRNTLLHEIIEDCSPDDVIKKLEIEVSILTRKVDVSELELQTLRKQIAKESKKGHEFSKEVASLKEECEKLKADNAKEVKVNDTFLIEAGDPWALVNELRQELNYEKDLNSNLRLQLQKTQDSNAELILAVQDLDEMLDQKDLEMSKSKCGGKLQKVKPKSDTDEDDDEEQKALEEIVREHSGVNEAYLLEQKIMDLEGEMELYRRDKDELEIQMEQIALDYEILKQENHEMSSQIEQNRLHDQLNFQYELENQIESLENELKMNISAINDLENVIKNLEEDLENQAHGFMADLEELTRAKIEHEKRAIMAEESLRKMKLQNANTAERLQEEFRRLSTQMSLTFEANEKVAMNAMDEANKLRVEKMHLEEKLERFKEDLECIRDHYEEKMVDFLSQITLKSKQLEKMEIEIENISSSSGAEIEKLRQEKENLESQRKDLENEVYLTKIELEKSTKELTESTGVQKDQECEIKQLQSEIERLKSRCNDMKMFLIENDHEKEKMVKQISQLKVNLKSKEDAFNSMEKKLKDINNRTTNTRNNRSSKDVTNLNERIKQLEGQIKLKETILERSETSFMEKEKDLERKIEELEKRLEGLDQSTESSQVSAAEISRPAIIRDQENLDALSNEMASLKNRNKAMEFELNEMQERYSEISLKFAEVEGERQQLVMTLRNLKNAKKF